MTTSTAIDASSPLTGERLHVMAQPCSAQTSSNAASRRRRCFQAETAAMLFWALLASGQIVLRKVGGWATFPTPLAKPIDLAA